MTIKHMLVRKLALPATVLTAALVLVACGVPLSPIPVLTPLPGPVPATGEVEARPGQEFVLATQQTAIVVDSPDRFGITFFNVSQDTRCPKEVQCVEAGEARVNITFQENGLLHPPILEMSSVPGDPKNTLNIEGYVVELVDLEPPQSNVKPVSQDEYRATFRITQAQPTPVPTPGGATTGALDQPLTVKMFQQVEFPQAGMRVTMNGILEDSRCPRQVDCVQAGRAVVSFRLDRNNQIGFLALSTTPPDGRATMYFQDYAIELLGVEPYPETPDQNIRNTDYMATIVVREMQPPTEVRKNQGVRLHIGESAKLADENATLTLVNVSNDSRCPINVTCAVRGNAVVEAKLTQDDGTAYTFILNEDGTTPNQRIPDGGSWGIELVALNPYPFVEGTTKQPIRPEEYEATLVVRKFASPQPLATPTPSEPVCSGLTHAQAQAIVGEPLQKVAQADVQIHSVPFDSDSQLVGDGICGYVSVDQGDRAEPVPGEPVITSSDNGLYGLAAARLTGADVLELARVADVLRGANPDADRTPYLILKTRLMAGDWNGIFSDFRELAGELPNVQYEGVDSFGDEGIWVWRETNLTNYAALVVRDGDSFVLLEALLPNTVGEAGAKESLHALMGKLVN